MGTRAEKEQTGLVYDQKILIQVAIYFEQKPQSNIYCNHKNNLQYTLANKNIFMLLYALI